MTQLASLVLATLISANAPNPLQNQVVGLRVIVVPDRGEASGIRERALTGESFEELAAAYSTDASRVAGGYIGIVSVSDLSREYQDALTGLAPGQISPVTEVGREFVLLLPLDPGETNWLEQTNAGLRAFELGRMNEAEARLEEALAQARQFGPGDYRLNVSLSTLAGILQLQGNFGEAERIYRASLEVAETAVGPSHPDVARALTNLGLLYQEQAAYPEAEAAFEQAQEILVGAFGPNHPDVALGLNNLARLRHAQGNFARAESLYQVALSVLEQTLGPNDLAVAETLDGLAALLREMNRGAEAAPLEARGESIRAGEPN